MTLVGIMEDETNLFNQEHEDDGYTLYIDSHEDTLKDDKYYISTAAYFTLYSSSEDREGYETAVFEEPISFRITVGRASGRKEIHSKIKREIAKILLERDQEPR